MDRLRLREIDALVGRKVVNNAYIITNDKKGTTADIAKEVEYVQVAYMDEKGMHFKNVAVSELV